MEQGKESVGVRDLVALVVAIASLFVACLCGWYLT